MFLKYFQFQKKILFKFIYFFCFLQKNLCNMNEKALICLRIK